MGENVCKVTDKELISKMYKQLTQLNIKEQTAQFGYNMDVILWFIIRNMYLTLSQSEQRAPKIFF